jgi:hypothetical protein
MPRYFFNIKVPSRKTIRDPEGGELRGDKDARIHAEMVARDMMANRIWYKRNLEYWAFVITDESGRQVAVVPFAQFRTVRKSKGAT